jgi:hypothetical protein
MTVGTEGKGGIRRKKGGLVSDSTRQVLDFL